MNDLSFSFEKQGQFQELSSEIVESPYEGFYRSIQLNLNEDVCVGR